MPDDLWTRLNASCFGHLRREPEPQMSRHERALAEQFAEDLDSIATDLASEVSRYGVKVRDGELGCPAAGEREEMLTELMRWAAKAKQIRKGEA